MPRKKISDIVEARILQLLRQGYSQPRIVNILKLDGIHVSQRTVSNVKRKIGRHRNSESKIKIFRKKASQIPYIPMVKINGTSCFSNYISLTFSFGLIFIA